MNIRKDDQVEVITGDDKGTPSARKVAKVLRVLPEKNKIVVEGVNRVYKHVRPSQRGPGLIRLRCALPLRVTRIEWSRRRSMARLTGEVTSTC